MKFKVLDFPIGGSQCRYQNVKFNILFTYCTSKAWWNSYIFYNKISASYQGINRSKFKTRSGHFDVFLGGTPCTCNVSLQP